MADYAASSSIVAPQDPGMGATGHHDPNSAGILSSPAAAVQPQVVSGLDVSVDTANDEVTVGSGLVILRIDNPDVQTNQDGSYDRTMQGPVPVAASVSSTTFAADVDAVNTLYVYIDPSQPDEVQYRVGSSVSAPSSPYIYLGDADTTSSGGFTRYAYPQEEARARTYDFGTVRRSVRAYGEFNEKLGRPDGQYIADIERLSGVVGYREADHLMLDYIGPQCEPNTADYIPGDRNGGWTSATIDMGYAPLVGSDNLIFTNVADHIHVKHLYTQDTSFAIDEPNTGVPSGVSITGVRGGNPAEDLMIVGTNTRISDVRNAHIEVYDGSDGVVIWGTDQNTTVTFQAGATNGVVYGLASVTDNDGSNVDNTA